MFVRFVVVVVVVVVVAVFVSPLLLLLLFLLRYECMMAMFIQQKKCNTEVDILALRINTTKDFGIKMI